MRELKFRAWHKDSREMLHAGVADIFIWQHEGQPIEIMQFTGLLDRNSKEIYEGDIVRLTCGCGYQENPPVEWRDGHNGYFARAKWQHYSTVIGAYHWDNDQLELNWSEHSEVIGNIYEDAELLSEAFNK